MEEAKSPVYEVVAHNESAPMSVPLSSSTRLTQLELELCVDISRFDFDFDNNTACCFIGTDKFISYAGCVQKR